MAMGPILGPGRRGPQDADGGDQRHADGRRDAGAADHLHGHRALARQRRPGRRARKQGGGARAERRRRSRSRSNAQGQIFVDDSRSRAARSAPCFASASPPRARTGGPRLFLRADRALDYGRVMQVMGEINRAGLRRVALVSTRRGRSADGPGGSNRPRRRGGRAMPPCSRPVARLVASRGLPTLAMPSAIEVSYVDEVGLTSASPDPSPRRRPAAAARGRPARGGRAGAVARVAAPDARAAAPRRRRAGEAAAPRAAAAAERAPPTGQHRARGSTSIPAASAPIPRRRPAGARRAL